MISPVPRPAGSTASGLFAPSVRVPGAPPAARPLRQSARPARARHAPRPRATAYSVCGRESRVRVPPRARHAADIKPVGMNIPVDPPRFSRAGSENSRAGGGNIHTNSIAQIAEISDPAGVDRFTQLMPLFIIEVSNLYLLYRRSWHDQSTPLGA